MSEIARSIIMGGFLLAVAAATWIMFRGFLRGLRSTASLSHQPIPVIFPLIPVHRTAWVVIIGAAAVLWAALHLLLAGWWAFTGSFVPHSLSTALTAGYVAFAGVLVAAGGVLLLACMPHGRRMISWGLILLILLALFGLTMAMFLPKYDESHIRGLQDAASWSRIGRVAAFAMAGHLVLDVFLGAMAQRVGRPKGYREEQDTPIGFMPDMGGLPMDYQQPR